ncbi:unnamed protein product [Nippostrongylus brasiliensis]|uniref:NAD(+) kinase n=1 Tax=Nippostrongylus brasiliensis TaxID=27835 RepID=A0A0N4Y9U3_NIPBR|nr:unnamed protein product [Nippostrongylus brasiliensis]
MEFIVAYRFLLTTNADRYKGIDAVSSHKSCQEWAGLTGRVFAYTMWTVKFYYDPNNCFRTAIVLPKTTRLDWEKQKHPHSEAHITTQVVSRQSLSAAVKWADLVVSAGGDGTFLTAAAAVTDKTPVIGINTDPVGSEGHLCIGGKNPPHDLIERIVSGRFRSEGHLCIGGKNPPHDLIERIVSGRFRYSNRSRIRVTALNKKPDARADCILALNEVFVGEDEAAKVSTYSISIDDSPMVKQKSSGLIVSTGTGSTSWYYGMNRVEEQTVSAILEAMQSMGLEKEKGTNFIFSDFAYSIREPIFNGTFQRTSVRGFARRIRLKSKCSRGFLVLDGATKIPFSSGAEFLLEINEADALRTITL